VQADFRGLLARLAVIAAFAGTFCHLIGRFKQGSPAGEQENC
jgi:hypothetical protein